MYIKTFGGFSIEKNYTDFTKNKIEIFIYSVIKRNYINVENLINNVWFENDNKPLKKDIAVYFSKINKKLKNYSVRLRIRNVRVILEGKLDIDTELFESIANKFFETNDLNLLDEILKIYKGPFLLETDSLWAESYRKYYEEIFLKY
ncbi:hypothetical protein SU69_06355 [Thermosipho melanesiensis]|uniref:SARP family transcriptional regulator n=1 Tax=Thermosipho melanesiensis TaxID=46541 RepID=A0ABN4UXN9_9BACT|nr:hypothetical protein [Thermosipho melanesiensis]APT74893.1 hypothetical protein BW47_06665 [Thermosipho melanesiensis]OOC36141.1 hypothetical protein SU68_06425 [Thermosipho melanesiensis]OOC36958.1 hypothetical protein SU69_06355 [Thermosipho melanesiensis]OOC37710.1 hypothetical protein SU70_06365 [Thermosipho melanesiensis]OOC40937.1 hypothetical protein SU71_06345 [Thermosipho melanesiensis]